MTALAEIINLIITVGEGINFFLCEQSKYKIMNALTRTHTPLDARPYCAANKEVLSRICMECTFEGHARHTTLAVIPIHALHTSKHHESLLLRRYALLVLDMSL